MKLPLRICKLQYLTDEDINSLKKLVEKNYLLNKESIDFQNDIEMQKLCNEIYEEAFEMNKENEIKNIFPNFSQHTMQYYMYIKYFGEPNLFDQKTVQKNDENGMNINNLIGTTEFEIYKEYIIDEMIRKSEEHYDRSDSFTYVDDYKLEYIKFIFVDINDDGQMELIVPHSEEYLDFDKDDVIYTIYDNKVKRFILDNYFSDEGGGYRQYYTYMPDYTILESYGCGTDGDILSYKNIINGELKLLDEVYIPNPAGIKLGIDYYKHNGEIVVEDEVHKIAKKYYDTKDIKVPIIVYFKQLIF